MAPRVMAHPGTRPTERMPTVDTIKSSVPAHSNQEDLYRAACSAMRLLQDRQTHTPEEMLDPRERKVLRTLRTAIRRCSS